MPTRTPGTIAQKMFWLSTAYSPRRPRDGGDGIKEPEAGAKRHAERLLRADRPADPGGLDQDQREQEGVSGELQPARVNRGDEVAAGGDPRQEADQDRVNPLPDGRNAGPIDEQHIQVDA